ncbi:PREDICTED: uncharacterized protein LOC106821370 [Priapulus caudatus]|uniref:Uncharacterized protein LOC106821370 n=1 Tax=Priapulus caudatus TaxID=37621 RepID=A0ABM1FB02_PRICU|nr:PREDICTED: uncharacterized protein LOC106821370 [Priapulus caudatus]
MERVSACYCCHGNSPPPASTSSCPLPSAMDIDSALHELGMLSTVTESRRQFLRERECAREPKPSSNPNSPAKPGFRVLHMNSQYVTGLLVAPASAAVRTGRTKSLRGLRERNRNVGAPYARADAAAAVAAGPGKSAGRMRSARRFKRPYQVPWHDSAHTTARDASAPPPVDPPPPARERNISESSELPQWEPAGFARSKSLDDLRVDLGKLLEVPAEGRSVVRDKKEIDKVSQHLQNLQVK